MFKKVLLPLVALSRSARYSQHIIPRPLRSSKPKSVKTKPQNFVDLKYVRTVGGKGGDGAISFLSLWKNEHAGPDGGDGGNGGHVIFQATSDTKDLGNVSVVLTAEEGEKGGNKDCFGKNAEHLIVKVPIGTIVKNKDGKVVGDLSAEGVMFIAARGGAGGKGNHFFVTDVEQTPEIAEYGAKGEDLEYTIEVRTMAHVGLIGFPNAGKSTLLRAISRARPKVAPYPFTTLQPYVGMLHFDDYEQIAIADLPGLIPDSHKNRGLGIQFLKHAERCMGLIYILDASADDPMSHFDVLQYELSQFSQSLNHRPALVVANKIDLEDAQENVELLKKHTDLPVIPVSAKVGTNLTQLLLEIRKIYDSYRIKDEE